MRHWLVKSIMFLRGMRLLPPRAGMIAMFIEDSTAVMKLKILAV